MAKEAPPLPRVVRETLEAFLAGLRRELPGRLVDACLFGSYARGEAHAESDMDVLVLLDRVDGRDERTITDLAADLIWQLHGIVISPLVMSVQQLRQWKALERRTPLEIERDGIAL